MENQHKKIKGYRDLSQQEIDLMNRIKEHGEETKSLLNELSELRSCSQNPTTAGGQKTTSAQFMESMRCLDLARASLQTGQMWFVRSVALPESF